METIVDLDSLEQYFSKRDNGENIFYVSDVPEVCKKHPCILGIDEAGRGPVLGPMVYGTAFCPINEQIILQELHCADSKALTEETRDEIFTNILKMNKKIGWAVEAIAPNNICNNMLGRSKYSLNQISMDAAIKLIKTAIEKEVKVEHVFVDTVGKPETYQEYLKQLFPNISITVAKKADSTYPIVSAASICAKVSRDHFLKEWMFKEGLDIPSTLYGSGYPNDPLTKKFLINSCDPVFGYPQLVRFSWSTSTNALKESAYHVDFPEQEDPKKKSVATNMSIASFFKLTNSYDNKSKKEDHDFFSQRFLSRNVNFD